MANDSKNKLAEALREASRGNARSKVAQLREIFDEIEAAKASGLSHKTIVAILENQGLVFTQGTFDITRYRISKERKGKRQTAKSEIVKIHAAATNEEEKISQKFDAKVARESMERQKPSTQEVKNLMKNEIDLSQYE